MVLSKMDPLLVIAKNIGALTVANVLGRLLNFAIVALVVRAAGTDGLGGYATANALAGFFLILGDIGLAPRLVREASADPTCTRSVYTRSLSVKTVTSCCACLILGCLYVVLPYESWVSQLLVLLSISWLIRSYTQLNHSVMRAGERMELEALSVFVQSVVFVGGTLACLALDFSLVYIGWAAVVAALAQLAVATVITRRVVTVHVLTRPHWPTMREATPYATTILAYVAFSQSYVVILSLIASQSLVGEFSSVARILLLAGVFPELVNLASAPASSRVFGKDDIARFRHMTTVSLRAMLIVAGSGAVLLISVSQPLMRLAYGAELEPLYPLLQLGTIYVGVLSARGGLQRALTSSGRQGSLAKAVAVSLAASVAFVIVFTKLLGVLGAVVAMVLGEFVLAAMAAVSARDLVDGGDIIRNGAWVLAASAAAIASHFALAAAALPVLAVGVPLVLYAALLLPSGEFQLLANAMRYRR
jgi:O-antigen/teichoic acid export membrane protein